MKEYVQALRFDQCQIQAGTHEQLIPLHIPKELPRQKLAQGYTHLHFRAARIALTFYGRKGIPAVSRLALLDTHFTEYQHTCIGTVQTTLNAGTIFITLYPNFNMSMRDPHLCSALNVQVQIVGAP